MTTTATEKQTLEQLADRLEPTPGRLVVKPVGEEETMRGGLHIPASAQEKPIQGTIVALGPEKKTGGRQLKVGQRILFGKFAGTELVVEGEDLLILGEEDVLAIFHPRPDPA